MTAGLERLDDRADIVRPICAPHRFGHLDADHGVIDPAKIAIVGQAELPARIAILRIGKLLGRKRDPVDRAPFRQRGLGERAPAASDLQYRIARPGGRAFEHRGDLGGLRIVQRLIGCGEDRARIGHPGIEPLVVEIVAQIVMEIDVPARSAVGVAAKPVREAPRCLPWAARPRAPRQRRAVAAEQFEQRHRIGARPFLPHPCLIPSARTAQRQPQQRAPAPQFDRRVRPFAPPAQQSARAIGARHGDAARVDAGMDAIQLALEKARARPRFPKLACLPVHWPQIACGCLSTIQVWPLATSFCRSGALPSATALFCATTALSKVGAGSS